MNFAEELCLIANDVSLETKVWQLMKPYLKKIAADRHPNGCHVRFIGFGRDFNESIKQIMTNDGICEFRYSYPICGNPFGDGLIYWNKDAIKERYDFIDYHSVSDRFLEVTLTPENDVIIIDKKATRELKNYCLCSYIN